MTRVGRVDADQDVVAKLEIVGVTSEGSRRSELALLASLYEASSRRHATTGLLGVDELDVRWKINHGDGRGVLVLDAANCFLKHKRVRELHGVEVSDDHDG
jgi:hypothetical protein